MEDIPVQLLDGLSPVDRNEVGVWWARLADADQSQLADLCDPKRETNFFSGDSDETGVRKPVVIGGRFVPAEDTTGWAEWHAELFDYLLSNPELVLFAPPAVRTFHICTRHEGARVVLAEGRIAADFPCPLGSADCPMRRLLREAPIQAGQQTRVSLQLFAVRCH